MGDDSAIENITTNTVLTFTLLEDELAPWWTDNATNATDEHPRINEYIQLNVTLHDDVDLNSYVFSWNNSGMWVNESPVQISGEQYNVSLAREVTQPRDTIIGWRLFFNDSSGKTNETDRFTFTVRNTPPDVPVLDELEPDADTFNRTPTFNWTSFDADGDDLTFNLTIICHGGCTSDNRDYTTSEEEFTIPEDLQFLWDEGYHYSWTVQACDQESCSGFADERNFTVSSFISIGFTVNSTDFGAMTPGGEADTEDDSPPPLVVANRGNIYVNVSLHAEDPLFERTDLPSPFLLAKIRDASGSFSPDSNTSYFQIQPEANATMALRTLNYSGDTSADIDLRVQVPLDEPPGEKATTIVAVAVMS